MTDYTGEIKSYLAHETDVLQKLDVGAINGALNLLHDTLQNDGVVYIFGNGGSAATASHFQNDFNKGISEHTEKSSASSV